MGRLKRLIGIKTKEEIVNGLVEEPNIQNAIDALEKVEKHTGIAQNILDDILEAETRLRRKP